MESKPQQALSLYLTAGSFDCCTILSSCKASRLWWCRPHPKTELSGPFDTPRRSVGALRVNGSCDYGPTPNRPSTSAAPSCRRKTESTGWAAFVSATLNSCERPGFPNLIAPAGMTDCFQCQGDAPCRVWIPAFAGMTEVRDLVAAGRLNWGMGVIRLAAPLVEVSNMEKRLFGRTGHHSTVVTFGAIVVGRNEMPQDRADKLIELVFEHGINHVDVAPSYGRPWSAWRPGCRGSATKYSLAPRPASGTRTAPGRAYGAACRGSGSTNSTCSSSTALATWSISTRSRGPEARWRQSSRRGTGASRSGSGSPATGRRPRGCTWRRCAGSTSTR